MITMDTNFPSGNGLLLEVCETDGVSTVHMLAQSKINEPMPLWFYFRLCGLYGDTLKIRLENADQCLGDRRGWITNAIVFREQGGYWKRSTYPIEIETKSSACVPEYTFPILSADMEFAFCFPYPMSEVKMLLNNYPLIDSSIIGYSNNANQILRLTNPHDSDSQKYPGIYIVARQHAGEVSAAWVLDGMIRFLFGKSGKSYRDSASWWFVPAIDVDGVEAGYYGKDQVIGDLARSWHPSFPKRTEAVAVKNDIQRWQSATDGRLLLDLHSPGHAERGSYFPFRPRSEADQETDMAPLCKHLAEELRTVGLEPCHIHRHSVNSNTSSQSGIMLSEYVRSKYPRVLANALEISYQGASDGAIYSIADYQLYGACLIRAIAKIL